MPRIFERLKTIAAGSRNLVSGAKERFADFGELLAHSRRKESDIESPEFLPGIQGILESEPGRLAKAVPMTLGLMILVGLVWMWFTEIDVVSPTPGKIIPNSRLQLIQPETTSVIEAILVEEGATVTKGQPLVRLRSNDVKADVDRLRNEHDVLLAKKARYIAIQKSLAGKPARLELPKELPADIRAKESEVLAREIAAYREQIGSKDNEIARAEQEEATLKAQVARLEKLLPFAQKRADRMTTLSSKGMISDNDRDTALEDYLNKQGELNVQRSDLAKVTRQIAIARSERRLTEQEFRKRMAEEALDTERQLTGMTAELDKSETQLASRLLSAPMEGTVHAVAVNTVGGVVQSGEVLMQVVPKDSPLEVEVKVLNRDVGYVEPGQKVKVKLDTFPYTKYGYLEGVVRSVGHASVKDDKMGEVYPAIVELGTTRIRANERWVALIPGMTCMVDVKIAKRQLIDYLISPFLRYQDEALRER